MSSFSVEILDPYINTLEIETSVGNNTSRIDIIRYDSNNIIIDNAVIPFPADYINSIDAEIASFLKAGSGINLISNTDSTTISVSGLNSSYINNFNSSVDSRIASANLQPSGNYSVSGHTHISSNIIDFNSSVSGLIPSFSTELDVYIKNTTGGDLYKGQVVYINGAQGDHPTITLAVASGEMTSSKTLGLLKQNLAINEFGYVISEGILEGIDTSSANSAGDTIWLSSSTPGGVVYGIANKPSAPNHMVFIGYVLRKQQNNGRVYIKPQNGYELEELHNVAISGVTNGQFLQYNSSSGLWIPSSSGNFSSLSINNSGISLIGHSHNTSDLTNFNSSVSGLLPITTLNAGSGIGIVQSGTIFTVSTTGTFGLTQSQVDARVNSIVSGIYALLNSPNFSGIPLVPTASSGTNTQQIASTAFVRTEISNLVASAPSTLDTLNELATALGNDPNFATTVTNSLAGKANLSGATFTGSISGPSGNFTSLKVNNVNVSASGHTHTSFPYLNINVTGFVDGLAITIPAGGSNTDYQDNYFFKIDNYEQASTVFGIDGYGAIKFGTIDNSQVNGLSNVISEQIPTTIVHTTGNQSISGIKTFNNNINISGLLTSTSGNFASLKVNNVHVSPSGHLHTSSDIINFNSSVSGLLPVGTANYLSKFGTNGSGLSDSSIYDNGTNVGIGTTSPSKKLDVIGDARVSGVLNLVNASDSTNRSIAVTSNNMTFAGVHGIFEYSVGLRGSRGSACGLESNATNGYLALAAGGSEKVRIATDGKVGIGTTNPSDQLHVIGSGRFSNSVSIGSSTLSDSNLPSIINNTNLYLWSNFN
jgi:hypothetical protein